MFDIHAIWNAYIGTKPGKEAIGRFENLSPEELTLFYNKEYASYTNQGDIDDLAETFYCYGFSELEPPTSPEEAEFCLKEIGCSGLWEEGVRLIEPQGYNLLIGNIVPLSFAASAFSPDYFYPYLFVCSFAKLHELLGDVGMQLHPTPKRAALGDRYMYYWEICTIFKAIRDKFNLTHTETCVFIYDFLPFIHKNNTEELPNPTQCWFIGGKIDERTGYDDEFWQVNKDTRPGDILIHYETSPVSGVTAIWRSKSHGCIDPFFHWHSYASIGNRIDVPKISLAELKTDDYFSQFPLTKKNFQGVNGFPMPAAAYNRLLSLLHQKGFDTSVLPFLYAPDFDENDDVKNERDVEEKLLIPLLRSMGLKENTHYKPQVGIHVGCGHRVFPDYIVDFKVVDGSDEARILIEAKYDMRNRQDIEKAFRQAKSYALNLKSEYIILCDKKQMIIYKKIGDDFNIDKYTVYSWNDIENPDIFNKLKTIFIPN